MARDHALGIDLGTSSVKVVAVDPRGRVAAGASASYALHTPSPGWVEQDAADWWRATCAALRELTGRLDAGRIGAVSLSGQLNGAVFLDDRLQPLRPVPIWLDHRADGLCESLEEAGLGTRVLERAWQRLTPVNSLAKILWVREHEPEVYGRTRVILLPKDWLRLCLTGTVGSDVTDASVTAALDLAQRRWSSDLLQALRVDESLLPPLSESIDVVGAVTAEAAAATGLLRDTPVCAGGGDMPCLAVGSGVVRPGVVGLGIGTAAHATAFSADGGVPAAAAGRLWPMCHPQPGCYTWLGCSFTGGESLRWLRDVLGGDFDGLTAEAATAPPGSEGLLFAPWLEGRATPGPDAAARGTFLGLSLRHGRPHLVRALMEGVAYELRECLECFRRAGLAVEEIRIGEGGMRSVLWRQIVADVVAAPVRVIEVQDLSALGAALIAAVGTGLRPGFEEACRTAVELGPLVRPDAAAQEVYEAAFQRYGRIYPAVRDWYAEG